MKQRLIRPRLRGLLWVALLLLITVWAISYRRPLTLRISITPQNVCLMDATRGRVRLLNQQASPATVAT